jgi:hypothetical protein
MEDERNAYYIFIGKPQENRTLRRHKHRWENNAEIGHHEQ